MYICFLELQKFTINLHAWNHVHNLGVVNLCTIKKTLYWNVIKPNVLSVIIRNFCSCHFDNMLTNVWGEFTGNFENNTWTNCWVEISIYFSIQFPSDKPEASHLEFSHNIPSEKNVSSRPRKYSKMNDLISSSLENLFPFISVFNFLNKKNTKV